MIAGLRSRRHSEEVARIQTTYRQRDATGGDSSHSFSNPGYTFYLQQLEWVLFATLRRVSFELPSARALDVGCGGGYFTHRLLEYGATVTGIDLVPERIEAARVRYPGIEFWCANAAELPFGDSAFNLVTQFTCLSSVLDPDLRTAIAAEMWRVLAPGGAVISYDLRPASAAVRVIRWLGDRRRRRDGVDHGLVTPTIAISEQELRRLFPQASLRYASTGLAFGLCRVAARSYFAAQTLARLPLLREHGIGVLVKPSP
jgi:SAM-dependent methyltransferase